jgi:septum formation protein
MNNRTANVRPSFILASASPRRSELLRQLNLEFAVVPSDAPEIQPDYLTPVETAKKNAWRKAVSVAKKRPEHLVLGADTLVCLGLEVFGKPSDLGDAQRMLLRLQGKTHWVVTGVCLCQLNPWYHALFAEVTEVTFRRLNKAEVGRYLTLIDPLDKAGAYAIQEHGDYLTARVTGSISNVVGLPIERLRQELEGSSNLLHR